MLVRRTGWIAVGMLGLVVGAARGDHRHDCGCLERLAGEFQKHTQELACEFRDSYRQNPHYWALRANVRELSSTAQHLQLQARYGSDLAGIQCDLQNLSRGLRHLTQTVEMADASCGGTSNWRHGGRGPVRIENVVRLLACLDKTLCQLNEEFAQLQARTNVPPTYVPGHRTGHHRDWNDFGRRDPGSFSAGAGRNPIQGAPGNLPWGFSLQNGRLTFRQPLGNY